VLEKFLGKSEFANHGQRVVEGQRLTQSARDLLLGWTRAKDVDGDNPRDYYVRQLWDGKSLTTFDLDDYVYVYEALRAGASGFLLKDARADELRQAVRTVESGDALLSPAITRPPDRELHTPASTDRAPNPPSPN
jgi:DNA-binding NarL/FixJ family response regulator